MAKASDVFPHEEYETVRATVRDDYITPSTKEWLKQVIPHSQQMRLDRAVKRFKDSPNAASYTDLERAMLAYQKCQNLTDEQLLILNGTKLGETEKIIDGFVNGS